MLNWCSLDSKLNKKWSEKEINELDTEGSMTEGLNANETELYWHYWINQVGNIGGCGGLLMEYVP